MLKSCVKSVVAAVAVAVIGGLVLTLAYQPGAYLRLTSDVMAAAKGTIARHNGGSDSGGG